MVLRGENRNRIDAEPSDITAESPPHPPVAPQPRFAAKPQFSLTNGADDAANGTLAGMKRVGIAVQKIERKREKT